MTIIGADDGDAPWTLTVAPGVELGSHGQAGQLIGWVGDSGNAEGTTPHTHFELRSDGRPMNPYSTSQEAFDRDGITRSGSSPAVVGCPRLPYINIE